MTSLSMDINLTFYSFQLSRALQVIEKGDDHQLLRMSSSLPINASEELTRVQSGISFNTKFFEATTEMH